MDSDNDGNPGDKNDPGENILHDAIVIGLGGVGSFALRSLSKGKKGRLQKGDSPVTTEDGKNNKSKKCNSGLRVLGLEQFTIGHAMGSSH